jgi:alkylation response protein AidB-like acyl-CoA dehydrogenase
MEAKMDLELTKEQAMFRDMAREFALREILPTARERDREARFFPEIIKKSGQQGLTGVKVPQEYGGLGLDWLTLGLIAEQICYFDFAVGITLFSQTSLEVMPILSAGDDSQKKKYLPPLGRGEIVGCFAAVEPNAGSDATAIETTAVLDGDQWVLNGNKTWITNATVADFAIVIAQTDKSKGSKGITAFLVDKNSPGFSHTKIEHKLGVRSNDVGQLFFRDCRIPRANHLGPVGRGMSVALTSIEHTRYGISWAAVGVMQACIDACVKYSQERTQFAKPIGSFQLVQERIAEMVVDCEASRWLSYRVAYLKDKGLPYSRETAIAKFHNVEAMAKATRMAVELHGAYGFTDDFPVERYYRDAIAPLVFGGTAHVQKLIIGRMTLGIDAITR